MIRNYVYVSERIFSLFTIETIIFRISLLCNSIFDVHIPCRGCLSKLKNYGNSRGVGRGLTSNPWKGNSKLGRESIAKVPLVVGEGWVVVDVF